MTTEQPKLPPEQQHLLEEFSRVWALMPALRFGQVVRYLLEAAPGQRPLAALPVIDDAYIGEGLAALAMQLSAQMGHPDAD